MPDFVCSSTQETALSNHNRTSEPALRTSSILHKFRRPDVHRFRIWLTDRQVNLENGMDQATFRRLFFVTPELGSDDGPNDIQIYRMVFESALKWMEFYRQQEHDGHSYARWQKNGKRQKTNRSKCTVRALDCIFITSLHENEFRFSCLIRCF